MKKLFLSIMLMELPLLASAYDCQVDGIYYYLNSSTKEATVMYRDSNYNSYSGSITIPESFTYEGVEYYVTTIGSGAFQKCTELTSVSIPNSVTNIGYNAFNGCIGLTSITIPNSVTSIGNNAFEGCIRLTSVIIPNSVTDIGESSFSGCRGLTSITISNSMAIIPYSAFSSCSSITSVTIPNSVTIIADRAFAYCNGLTSVTIPNSVTMIGEWCFGYCRGMTSLSIGNSVTMIPLGAFQGCISLTSLTIPNSVNKIEQWAFEGCISLTSVTISSSVSEIGYQTFANCNKLEEVYCFAENLPSTWETFDKSYSEYATLYVPAKSLNAYKTTAPWNEFGNIKAISGTGEEPTKCATPTISYADKRLTFSCETEGVEYVYEITDADIKKGYESEVDLTATYEISVYATKSGYYDSDVATATLVWTDAIFTVTTPETPTSAKAVQESIPVLISANGGVITVKSEQEGQPVAVYTADGKALGSATVKDGQATVATNIQRGEIVIVKVGGRSVKVKM